MYLLRACQAASIALFCLSNSVTVVEGSENQWLSPEYKNFFEFPLPIPPVKKPITSYTGPKGTTIDYYEIEIRSLQQQVYPGLGKANLVGYDGISPGPTFRMTKGREALVRFINKSLNPSAIHLHGSYSRTPFDGWAEDTIAPGEYKDYYYPNNQAARTLWYHDHAVHITAVNAYFGQAGFYILSDPEELALDLPRGDYDIPLGLASKQYKPNGDLLSPAEELTSLYGDVFHVNGQPWPYLKVEPRKYRFRVLDTSISRQFKLYLEIDGTTTRVPFHVIGSDGGLLAKPVQTETLEIAMAERYDIVVDFDKFKGKNITFKNYRNVQADEDFAATDKLMRFVVGDKVTNSDGNNALPNTLRAIDWPSPKSVPDKVFKFERKNGMWMINGVSFSDIPNRILAKPPRGTTELWELQNPSGGWSHPVHIHLIDFQIISRVDGKRGVTPYEAVALKDVVLLGVNEKVRVLAKYQPWDGVYMFHCHNLIHEDHDMMAAFNVTALADFGYPETTRFIDPMEPRWRAKPFSGDPITLKYVQERTLPMFAGLDAYANVDEIEAAVDQYHATRVNGALPAQGTTLVTSTTKAAAAAAAAQTSAKTSKSSTTKAKRAARPTSL